MEDRRVYGWPGPRYKPVYVCAHPQCNERFNLELHHLWRRSHLGGGFNWVKLPDERVVGNVVYLCRPHHRLLTENEALIAYEAEEFWWHGEDASMFPRSLNPQPPLSISDAPEDGYVRFFASRASTEPSRPLSPDEAVWAGSPVEKTSSEICEPVEQAWRKEIEPKPGEDCVLCKRRVPHPKKESSPKTTVTKSWRLPADEKEAREELLEDTARHLGIQTSEKFWLDKTILALCVLALQGPGSDAL